MFHLWKKFSKKFAKDKKCSKVRDHLSFYLVNTGK